MVTAAIITLLTLIACSAGFAWLASRAPLMDDIGGTFDRLERLSR